MPKINLGLGAVAGTILMLPTAAISNITAGHVGTYQSLLAAHPILSTLKNELDTYGHTTLGCGSSMNNITPYSTTYQYCTLSNWYYGTSYSGTGVFCFNSMDNCKKMSGINKINTNSPSTVKKGYLISSETDAFNLAQNTKTTVTITNDAFYSCLETCPSWQSWTPNTTGTEVRYGQQCNAAGSCVKYTMARAFRCAAGYYNANGTSATVSGSSNTLDCQPCPTMSNHSGTACDTAAPTAGTGTDITQCAIASGCESYDTTGNFSITSSCYYKN